MNANQVFGWRRLYWQEDWEPKPGMKLLPVRVSESLPAPLPMERSSIDWSETTAEHDSHRTAAGAGAHRRQRRSGVSAGVAGVPASMIALSANTRIWIAAGVTDLRRGFTGLSALVQTKLEQKPFSGHVFVFRGRRGDLIKVLWYDGTGCVCSRSD